MAHRAFITGIGGFVGSHLAEALLRADHRVEGTLRPGGSLQNIGHLADRLTIHRCDMRSLESLSAAIRSARPDTVYHLAGITSIPECERDPAATLETNLTGTLHLLQAIRQEADAARLLFVSSAEVYGKVPPEENPIREGRPAAPSNHYGLSKWLAEQLVRFYARQDGLQAVLLRPFNHIGPRQSDRFVCSSFVKQMVWIERGKADPVLHVGDLSPVRDFTDVRDVVEAYRIAAERASPGSLFHVASGKGVSIGEVLDKVLGLFELEVEVKQAPDRLRKTEIPVRIGDPTAFREATGWAPRFALEETLRDMAAYWRDQADDSRSADVTSPRRPDHP